MRTMTTKTTPNQPEHFCCFSHHNQELGLRWLNDFLPLCVSCSCRDAVKARAVFPQILSGQKINDSKALSFFKTSQLPFLNLRGRGVKRNQRLLLVLKWDISGTEEHKPSSAFSKRKLSFSFNFPKPAFTLPECQSRWEP